VPPTWLSKIRITTLPESNDQGSWFGIRVEHAGFVDDPKLYDMAREFHDTIVAGMAKADYHDAEADDSTDEEEKF
jgi:hypothetical protein